jgi:hypothetical protein
MLPWNPLPKPIPLTAIPVKNTAGDEMASRLAPGSGADHFYQVP